MTVSMLCRPRTEEGFVGHSPVYDLLSQTNTSSSRLMTRWNQVTPRMTRTQVTALLGVPDDVEDGYLLGCFIDCAWLRIDYNAVDLVVRAYSEQVG